MKILGKTSAGFVVEMGEYEAARIAGFGSLRDAQQEGVGFQIGTEIQVNNLWDSIWRIKRLSGELANARRLLESATKATVLAEPITAMVGKAVSYEEG